MSQSWRAIDHLLIKKKWYIYTVLLFHSYEIDVKLLVSNFSAVQDVYEVRCIIILERIWPKMHTFDEWVKTTTELSVQKIGWSSCSIRCFMATNMLYPTWSTEASLSLQPEILLPHYPRFLLGAPTQCWRYFWNIKKMRVPKNTSAHVVTSRLKEILFPHGDLVQLCGYANIGLGGIT